MRYLPKDIVNIILEYDGQIRYKNGEYINIIHNKDKRYDIIRPIIKKKKEIIKNTIIDKSNNNFNIRFRFDGFKNAMLAITNCGWYGVGVGEKNKLEICYFNIRKAYIYQSRTYI